MEDGQMENNQEIQNNQGSLDENMAPELSAAEMAGAGIHSVTENPEATERAAMRGLKIEYLLEECVKLKASDLHLQVGLPPILRIDGELRQIAGVPSLNEEIVEALVYSTMDSEQRQAYAKDKEFDYSFSFGELGRFRVNAFRERGNAAAQSIDRIVDVFPAHQQQQVRVQLAAVLQAVCAQRLIPAIAGGRVAAAEIMVTNPAIKSLIRDGKTHQLDTAIQTGVSQGMQTMDRTLVKMIQSGIINYEDARDYAVDLTEFERLARG